MKFKLAASYPIFLLLAAVAKADGPPTMPGSGGPIPTTNPGLQNLTLGLNQNTNSQTLNVGTFTVTSAPYDYNKDIAELQKSINETKSQMNSGPNLNALKNDSGSTAGLPWAQPDRAPAAAVDSGGAPTLGNSNYTLDGSGNQIFQNAPAPSAPAAGSADDGVSDNPYDDSTLGNLPPPNESGN